MREYKHISVIVAIILIVAVFSSCIPHNIGLGAANDMSLLCDLSITGKFAHKKNKEAIEYAESLGKTVVTLLVAGRNIIISEYVDSWDGIVMSYLPGSEGDGVVSVLSGEAGFTGKLPMPYYKSVEDIANEEAQMLYEFGID